MKVNKDQINEARLPHTLLMLHFSLVWHWKTYDEFLVHKAAWIADIFW